MFIGIYNDLTKNYVEHICNLLNQEGLSSVSYDLADNPYDLEFTSLPVFFAVKSGKPGYYLYGVNPAGTVIDWALSIGI